MATNVSDCLKILEERKKTGKKLFLGFNLRYDPVLIKIKEIIDSNLLGRIVTVENVDYYEGGKTYMARWNRFYDKTGGLFCHKGSHDFDIINWFLGMRKPLTVSAFAGNDVLTPENIPFEYDNIKNIGPYCRVCKYKNVCPDYRDHSGNLLFSEEIALEDNYYPDTCIYTSEKTNHDNGIAIIEYEKGARASHWECFFTPVSTRKYTVIGTRGHLEANLGKSIITVYPRWSNDKIEYTINRSEGGHGGADPQMIKDTISAINNEKNEFASVKEGILSVAIAQASEISRREKRTVDINELINLDKL